ncbi:hypothetical protein [Microbulbifer sp. S227A]|uniref:hypothetical protein n=1 Tax=Microbulbifer sp. S227A TaxID=3415131 RepID=UPI003C7AC442
MPDLLKRRNRIEIMFGRLKDWRRVATRYDDGDYFLEADKKVHASPLGSPETKAQILDQLAKLRMPRPKNVQAYIAEHKKLAALDQGLCVCTVPTRAPAFERAGTGRYLGEWGRHRTIRNSNERESNKTAPGKH